MERLIIEEVRQIKAEWDSPYMCKPNDFWENRINGLFNTIEAQQQEIEQLETRLADIEISADRISRDIYESDKVHIYISEIKARCGKFGANTTKILLDRLKDLTADKNKHTELLKQAREALEYCILSGCKPAQGVAESVISSITQQIGGTEK